MAAEDIVSNPHDLSNNLNGIYYNVGEGNLFGLKECLINELGYFNVADKNHKMYSKNIRVFNIKNRIAFEISMSLEYNILDKKNLRDLELKYKTREGEIDSRISIWIDNIIRANYQLKGGSRRKSIKLTSRKRRTKGKHGIYKRMRSRRLRH